MSEFRVLNDRENVPKFGTTGNCRLGRAVNSDFYDLELLLSLRENDLSIILFLASLAHCFALVSMKGKYTEISIFLSE